MIFNYIKIKIITLNKYMKEKLILISSLVILATSIIIFFIGPMIKGNNYITKSVFYDCSCYSDIIKDETNSTRKDMMKKVYNKCARTKTFNILEYLTIFINFNFSLFFIIYGARDKSRDIEKKIIVSIVPFVLTLVYISYNGYILNNDYPGFISCTSVMGFSTKYSGNNNMEGFYYLDLDPTYLKTNSEGAYAKFDYNRGRYSLLYPIEDETDIFEPYIKFKDLGDKKYNYNSDLILMPNYRSNVYNDEHDYCTGYYNIYNLNSMKPKDSYGAHTCNYLYINHGQHFDNENAAIVDKWIFSIFIASVALIFEIILFIMGFREIFCR